MLAKIIKSIKIIFISKYIEKFNEILNYIFQNHIHFYIYNIKHYLILLLSLKFNEVLALYFYIFMSNYPKYVES